MYILNNYFALSLTAVIIGKKSCVLSLSPSVSPGSSYNSKIIKQSSSAITSPSMTRTRFIQHLATFTTLLLLQPVTEAFAFSSQVGGSRGSGEQATPLQASDAKQIPTKTVAYKSLSLPIETFGVNVPVACWYPCDGSSSVNEQNDRLKYQHRISVKRIGELLARWDFIPEFACRNFELEPMMSSSSSPPTSSSNPLRVINGKNIPLPSAGPVVFLAHGFLGSRFDLSHLAESLAQNGFICFSPEFPESLAASYPQQEGLDRSIIVTTLLDQLPKKWNVAATRYGIIGHSLGCGTAIKTGDETWARVIIAGFPKNRDGTSIPGSVLYIASMNDGAMSLSRFGGKQIVPSDYVQLNEEEISFSSSVASSKGIPSRSALLFDRPDGPNHISFLAEGVNNAMIDLLSPLLPVAQALSIPVLDFDKYKDSRDSQETAKIVIPLVVNYLKQQMQ